MDLIEKTVESKVLFEGKIIKLRLDDIILPNGKPAKREVISHNGGCAVLPITDDGYILLVEQFRYPYKEVIFEIPAGKIDKNEDTKACAVRELKEETGCSAQSVEFAGVIYPSPGYTDEKIYIYIARGLNVSEASLDEDEFLNLKKFSIAEVMSMIETNVIKDAKTIVSVFKALHKI